MTVEITPALILVALAWPAFAIGVAYVIGFSRLTERPRVWLDARAGENGSTLVDLLTCPACLGFWIGVAGGAFMFRSVVVAIFWGFTTAGTNFILGRVTGLMPPPPVE